MKKLVLLLAIAIAPLMGCSGDSSDSAAESESATEAEAAPESMPAEE